MFLRSRADARQLKSLYIAVFQVEQSMDAEPPQKDEVKKSKDKAPLPGQMFALKKWNAVAMWSWDVECDTCAICRVQVMGEFYVFISCYIKSLAKPDFTIISNVVILVVCISKKSGEIKKKLKLAYKLQLHSGYLNKYSYYCMMLELQLGFGSKPYD